MHTKFKPTLMTDQDSSTFAESTLMSQKRNEQTLKSARDAHKFFFNRDLDSTLTLDIGIWSAPRHFLYLCVLSHGHVVPEGLPTKNTGYSNAGAKLGLEFPSGMLLDSVNLSACLLEAPQGLAF